MKYFYYLTLFSLVLFTSCSSGDSYSNYDTLVVGDWVLMDFDADLEFSDGTTDVIAASGAALDVLLGYYVYYSFYEDGSYLTYNYYVVDDYYSPTSTGTYTISSNKITFDGNDGPHVISELNQSRAEIEFAGSIYDNATGITMSNIVQGFDRLKSGSNFKPNDDVKPNVTLQDELTNLMNELKK